MRRGSASYGDLEFFGIAPGMRVAEIIAGFGYTTELLVRTVGPSGKVYAQNNRFIFDNIPTLGRVRRRR